MPPAVGCIVHFVEYGTPGGEYEPACRAAIITEVSGEFKSAAGILGPVTGLCVLSPSGLFFSRETSHDQGAAAGAPGGSLCGGRVYRGATWHWPEL